MKMKRTFALIASVVMAAAAMTACGSSDSSSKASADVSAASTAESTAESKAEESKAEESKAEESKAEESKAEAPAEESKTDEPAEESKADEPAESEPDADTGDKTGWGPLAKAYTEKLKGGVFSIDMVMKSSLTKSEVPAIFEVNGKDIHLKMTAMGMDIESYVIDGKTYSIMPSMNTYTVTEGTSADVSSISTYGLTDNAVLTDSGEKDGMQFETYKASVTKSADADEAAAAELDTEMTYYFDADGVIKKITASAPAIGDTELIFNAFSFDNVSIELPDLSGMTKLDNDAETEADPKSIVKMTMSILGITEDMLTADGYTVDQLAGMESEEMAKVLAEIAKKNGLAG